MQTLTKQPSEAVIFNFDFSAVIASSGSISSIVSIAVVNCGIVSGSSAATLSGNAFSGRIAQTLVSAGQHGETYKLTCKVTDGAGQTHEDDGLIEVVER